MALGDQTPSRLTEMPGAPNALSAFADTAYWVEGSDEEPGSVQGLRIGQSQPFTIATGQSQPNAITADAKYELPRSRRQIPLAEATRAIAAPT